MTGYSVIVDTSNGANVELDKTVMPAILIQIQKSGKINANNSHYRDSAPVRIILYNKIPKGFKNSDVDPITNTLKSDLIVLCHKIRYNFDFKINTNEINYEIGYDENDANLLGIVVNDTVTERVGINLACTLTPQPQQFIVVIKDADGNILQTFTRSGEYTVTQTDNTMIATEDFTYDGNPLVLANVPNIAIPSGMLLVKNGNSEYYETNDYTRTGNTITITNPVIENGETIRVIYTY